MSSPAKRKRDDSTSPTPTFGPHLQYCDVVGARVHAITLQSPPPPIQRGLKFFGLQLLLIPGEEYTCGCSNCVSEAITKAYTPTKRDNIIFEGGCLSLLDIEYYTDLPSDKVYYVINRRWFPVGEDGCLTLKGGYFGDGMKVRPIGGVGQYNKMLPPIGSMQELINNRTNSEYAENNQLLEQKYGSLNYIRFVGRFKYKYFVVLKDVTPPSESSSIYKLRQKCQSQLYLETAINLAEAGFPQRMGNCYGTLSNKNIEYYKGFFNNEEKMMKSVELAFSELAQGSHVLCEYAKQLKDAAQREAIEHVIARDIDVIIKNHPYERRERIVERVITGDRRNEEYFRRVILKRFNAIPWNSVFKDIEWYCWKRWRFGAFVISSGRAGFWFHNSNFIVEGTQWGTNNRFPYVSMEDSFDFFSTETYSSHPWYHHSATIKKIYNDIKQIYTDLNKFCEQAFEHSHYVSGEYLPLRESVSDADVVLALEKASNSMYQSAKHIRALIQPMQGTYYSKSWAVQTVIKQLQSSNNSTQAAVIDDLITNNRIPSTSAQTLSNLVRLKKKGELFIDDEWKTVRSNRKRGLALALVCEYPLFKKSFDERDYSPPQLWYSQDQFNNDLLLYESSTIIHLNNDLNDDILHAQKRQSLYRLYFSPRQFPTPLNLSHAVSCDSFKCLQSYIVEQSKKDREVSFTVADNGKSVRFACKARKRKECKFYFVLKWDEVGYYICCRKWCLGHSH